MFWGWKRHFGKCGGASAAEPSPSAWKTLSPSLKRFHFPVKIKKTGVSEHPQLQTTRGLGKNKLIQHNCGLFNRSKLKIQGKEKARNCKNTQGHPI